MTFESARGARLALELRRHQQVRAIRDRAVVSSFRRARRHCAGDVPKRGPKSGFELRSEGTVGQRANRKLPNIEAAEIEMANSKKGPRRDVVQDNCRYGAPALSSRRWQATPSCAKQHDRHYSNHATWRCTPPEHDLHDATTPELSLALIGNASGTVLGRSRISIRGVFDETRRKPLVFAADAVRYGIGTAVWGVAGLGVGRGEAG
jgi:hypothetical protein